VVISD